MKTNKHSLLLAVADGFSKGEYSGANVSQKVISGVSEWFMDGCPVTVLRLFESIATSSKQCMAGSTLAFALVTAPNNLVCAALGDSGVFRFNANGHIVAHTPNRLLPFNSSKLKGCFGDIANAQHHVVTPEIKRSQLNSGDIVMVCSDGVWVSDEDPIPSSTILRQAIFYGRGLAYNGFTAQDIVEDALLRGSTDNISVAVYRHQ